MNIGPSELLVLLIIVPLLAALLFFAYVGVAQSFQRYGWPGALLVLLIFVPFGLLALAFIGGVNFRAWRADWRARREQKPSDRVLRREVASRPSPIDAFLTESKKDPMAEPASE